VKRETILITALVTAGVIVLYVLFAFLPLARQLHARRGLLAAKERQFTEAQQLLARYPEYRARAIRIQLAARRLETRVPGQPHVPDLIKDITQAATESDIREFQFVPLAAVRRGEVVEQPVRMTLVCGFPSLGEFLMRLAGMPRLISARDVQLASRDKAGRDQALAAELTLVTYVQP
jgi:Tfp pilus assembly protein PilO